MALREIYVDESSQTKHRFLVLGAITVPIEETEGLLRRLRSARCPELPASELKWTKVSKAKLTAYLRSVDVFFESKQVHFHSIIVDTTKQNHQLYNQGSREIGFNKELYQLLMKFGRLYDCNFHVYLDRRTTTQATEDLRLIANRGIRKQGDRRDWPYRRLHFRDSHEVEMLQLTDLLIGAVAFRINGHHARPDASPAKLALSEHILRRAGVDDVQKDTMIRGKFTIWHRRLRQQRQVP
jgi:hypothetical protein